MNELPRNVILHGDSRELLKGFPDDSVDSVVTDPPAGISFMGKAWDDPDVLHDGQHKARDAFIAFLRAIMQECFRVLKPGGHALVWSIPRTSHWTATALEEAGFEVRDCIYHAKDRSPEVQAFLRTLTPQQMELLILAAPTDGWVGHIFGQGFPKSLNISKAIDKQAGAEREVIGTYRVGGNALTPTSEKGGTYGVGSPNSPPGDLNITKPATEEAQKWEGWGTSLKPAVEGWWLVRKPIEQATIVGQVLATGTGGINIDGTRIASNGDTLGRHNQPGPNGWKNSSGGDTRAITDPVAAQGRWPSNFVLSHSPTCELLGTRDIKTVSGSVSGMEPSHTGDENTVAYGKFDRVPFARHGNPDGTETVAAYRCADGCPILALDQQSGTLKSGEVKSHYMRNNSSQLSNGGFHGKFGDCSLSGFGDSGGASRFFATFEPEYDAPFFYTGKASKADKNADLDDFPDQPSYMVENGSKTSGLDGVRYERTTVVKNNHPTVKSQALMQYLVKLVTPKGGLVLDPFAGSGSTLMAAITEGFEYVGIEREQEYVKIAERRVGAVAKREKERRSGRDLLELAMSLGDEEDEEEES
jgi:site-specific DNA-methyltransferase (adenine-specific)